MEPTIENTFGAIFMGAVAAALLSGVISLQVYLYYYRWSNSDSHRHIVGVAVLWILDLFHLALTLHFAYFHLIRRWGMSLQYLFFHQPIPWSIKVQVTIKLFIVAIVHSLYASRVWMLGGFHRGYLGYFSAGIVLVALVVGGLLSRAVIHLTYYHDLKSIGWAVYTALSTWTTIDFFISFAMYHYLSISSPCEVGLKRKVSRLMRHIVTSGLLLSTLSLLTIFLFRFTSGSFIFLCCQFILSKVYVLSFLSMLNARDRPFEPARDHQLKTMSSYNLDSMAFEMTTETSTKISALNSPV